MIDRTRLFRLLNLPVVLSRWYTGEFNDVSVPDKDGNEIVRARIVILTGMGKASRVLIECPRCFEKIPIGKWQFHLKKCK
jgi:hypothetical protein